MKIKHTISEVKQASHNDYAFMGSNLSQFYKFVNGLVIIIIIIFNQQDIIRDTFDTTHNNKLQNI